MRRIGTAKIVIARDAGVLGAAARMADAALVISAADGRLGHRPAPGLSPPTADGLRAYGYFWNKWLLPSSLLHGRQLGNPPEIGAEQRIPGFGHELPHGGEYCRGIHRSPGPGDRSVV
ncbi:hypothetical protein GCM10027262_17120 [Nocardia tengchongensis]